LNDAAEFIALRGAAVTLRPIRVRGQQPRKISKFDVLWHGGNEKEEAIY
jgi:hypothetical protein